MDLWGNLYGKVSVMSEYTRVWNVIVLVCHGISAQSDVSVARVREWKIWEVWSGIDVWNCKGRDNMDVGYKVIVS